MPFDREARARIHRLARGVPRRINLLADRALLGAYAEGRSRVDRAIVEQAAREVFGATDPGLATGLRSPRTAWLAAGAAAGAVVAGVAAFALQGGWRAASPAPGSAAAPGAAPASAAAAPSAAASSPAVATSAAAASPDAPASAAAAATLAPQRLQAQN
jgi:general secretion pathway protein A